VWTRDEEGLSEWLDSDPDRRQPKQRTLTWRAPAALRKRGRPVDPSSKRQLKLTERAQLLEEDPTARAEREREEKAAVCVAESAHRSEIMRLHREARLRAMLASVQDEQQAEAEQLFWERAQLEDVALVAVRQRKRQRRGSQLDGSQRLCD
jgi:hypothetical protein